MQPRRILIVLPDPPLPFANAASRWFYVLCRELVERGNNVTIFSACDSIDKKEEAGSLFSSREYDLRCYPHAVRSWAASKWETLRRPYSYVFSPELQRDLQSEISRGCDVLHLEQLWTGWLGLAHVDRALINVHYSSEIDLAELMPSGIYSFLLQRQSLRSERALLRSYPAIATVTPRLTDYIRTINPEASVHTIGLGLDLSRYPFAPERPANAAPVVSLIGSFTWGPTYFAGVRLLTRLWPEIKRRTPRAQLQIVGRDARKAIGPLCSGPDVSFHENVPDTLPYFQRTAVLLYPAQSASGMKVKVLEAMALGVPVVTTSEGVEGLQAQDGLQAGICDDDAGLVARTAALLSSPENRLKLCKSARRLVETHCSSKVTVDAVEYVHDLIIERHSMHFQEAVCER